MRGGYRIKTELKEDLFDIKTLAELNRSTAEMSQGLGYADRRGIKNNAEKIKTIVDKWIGSKYGY